MLKVRTGVAAVSGRRLSEAQRRAQIGREAACQVLFARVADGAIVLDADERIVDVNPPATRILGRSPSELLGRPAEQALAEHRVLLGPPARRETWTDVTLGSGADRRSYEVHSLPLKQDDDRPGRLLILRDVTKRKQAEEERSLRLREEAARAQAEAAARRSIFLARASAVLALSLDYDATLQQVARLAVPELADWCTVYVLTEGGGIRRVATAYADALNTELAEALRRYPPSPVSPRSTVAEAMRTGRTKIIPVIPEDYVETIAQDAKHLEIMRKLAFRSSLVVPLQARGEVLGALALFRGEAGSRYAETDLPLSEDLARRAALAVDNARLYREAQRAIQLRNEFLSVAAHELKTPITILMGFAQVLLRAFQRDALDEVLVQRALEAIEQQSGRLGRLVSRLLDVSRLEGGGLMLVREITDLASLVQRVAAAARVTTPQHTLVVRTPVEARALVDPLHLEQVVTNLLDNAVKYSPEGGQVDVDLSKPAPGTVRLAVRDRGMGIPPEKREHIFDRFYRAHADDHVSGLGLGLYISRQIVELHGGSIRAEFPPDGGTRFVVDLPTDQVDGSR